MGYEVLLYIPNIIGYVRIALLLVALIKFTWPIWFLSFYISSIFLDFVDGIAARRLNQVSAFGAWFDVVIDLVSRGLLWCALYRWGYLLMLVEWVTFLSLHCQGPDWKKTNADVPAFVQAVMSSGFKSVQGAIAIGGLNILPLWLYAYEYGVLSHCFYLSLPMQYLGIVCLIGGRTFCMAVEFYFISQHILQLCNKEKPLAPINGRLQTVK